MFPSVGHAPASKLASKLLYKPPKNFQIVWTKELNSIALDNFWPPGMNKFVKLEAFRLADYRGTLRNRAEKSDRPPAEYWAWKGSLESV